MSQNRCPACKRPFRRSPQANARYWALLHVIADKIHPDGEHFGAPTWHLEFKRRFLGCDDVKLPSGRVVSIPRTTADLDVGAFADYMTQVEAWANERDAYLEDAALGK